MYQLWKWQNVSRKITADCLKQPNHLEQAHLKQEGWKFMKKKNEQPLSGM